MRRCACMIVLALCTVGMGLAPCSGQNTWQAEGERLAALLKWQAGDTVGEIGAGKGELTAIAAQRVGPSGKVYSTELDSNALAHLKELAAQKKTVVAVKAAEADANLPRGCCDSIFMRLVYHHLTKPVEIDASLFRALKPGGRLAVIDEYPSKGSKVPEGVPKNRGGHGIPQKILISELKGAGFEMEGAYDDWPGRDEYHQMYCVVFVKPER